MYEIFKMKLTRDLDLVQARSCVRQISTLVGFNDQDQVRLSTAIYEIASHVLKGSDEVNIVVSIDINNGVSQTMVFQVCGNKKDVDGQVVPVEKASEQLYIAVRLIGYFNVDTLSHGDTVFTLKKHLPVKSLLTNQCCREIAHQIAKHPPENLIEDIFRYNQELMRAMNELQLKQEGLLQINKELEETNRGVIALTLELEEKAERLRFLSFRDKMTGLYNRTYFEEEMNRLDQGRNYPVSIIVLDLDNLKLVNDSLGHKAGDELLITCAKLLQKSTRNEDVLARIGGDEFVLILPKTDTAQAVRVMERIKRAIREDEDTNAKFPLRVSMGCATSVGPIDSLAETFKKADTNMYKEKLSSSSTSQGSIVRSLMSTLAERDIISFNHAKRIGDMAKKMGEEIGMPMEKINELILLSQLHDLGKVGIPDSILFKPGKLTSEEWEIMKCHPEIGQRIAKNSAPLRFIADLILLHHERWDGKGYPVGLKGKEIPLECRIIAIIDAFDAMTNDRPYKKRISVQEAFAEIENCADSQFDPELVGKFISLIKYDLCYAQKYG